MNNPYVAPQFELSAFNCALCGAYANQTWGNVCAVLWSSHNQQKGWTISFCSHCRDASFWHWGKLNYPNVIISPKPNSDLSEQIQADYNEAREIFNKSPRGAAALLRLCIQNLCIQLGGKGNSINDDIALLVKNGLNPLIQKSLDYVRVVGNNAVHPGEIDIDDNPDIALKLFSLINIIADTMISQPKEIERLYSNLPDGAIAAIQKRDKS